MIRPGAQDGVENMIATALSPSSNLTYRIALVVHTFEMGGLERCVARLANHLDSRFRPVLVCLNRSGDAAKWIASPDVRIIELHKGNRNDCGVIRRLARVLQEERIDIVHSHNWGTLLETSFARRWAGVPVHVHAERGTLLGDPNVGRLRGRLRAVAARWAMNRSECVITVAESLRRKLEGRCGPLRRPVRLIPNGLDAPVVHMSTTELQERRRSLGIPDEATVLGSVGRLVPVKDFGTAIDVVLELYKRDCDTHLVLVGDGPERRRLVAHAADLGIADRVHLVGQQMEVGNWLAMMDVYLNVSLSEGMSQSLLEAMALGRPVVVTDVGDNAVLVDGVQPCGLVVPPRMPTDVAQAVTEILSTTDTPIVFAANARRRHAERYSIGTMVRSYERLYDELVGRCSVPARCGRSQKDHPSESMRSGQCEEIARP